MRFLKLLTVGLLVWLLLIPAHLLYAQSLKGDFDNDGVISLADYANFIKQIGKENCSYNFHSSCLIDIYDVNQFISVVGAGNPIQGSSVIYDVLATPETQYSGTIQVGSTTKPLKFRKVRSGDQGYEDSSRTKYKTVIARFATAAESTITLTLPSSPSWAVLYTPTSEIPTTIAGSTISFKLPAGPGIYALKTSVSTEAGHAEVVTFWVDDARTLALNPPASAIKVSPGDDLQAVINTAAPGSTIFLMPGTHEYTSIKIDQKNNLTFILHPSTLLIQREQPCANSNDCPDFISILSSSNITIKGPGEIRGTRGMKRSVIYVRSSSGITLRDFFLYKVHHRDGGQINMTRSENVLLEDVRVIGQNGGPEADSSKNVRFNRNYLEGQDDTATAKSRDRVVDGFYVTNNIVRSAASALKVGEATILYEVTNVIFENNTVLDSDRGMVVTPRGRDGSIGRIGSVLFKNNKIRFMIKNKFGKTIEVHRSIQGGDGTDSPFSSATNIVFENINADFVESADFGTKATIKNSVFNMYAKTDVFSGDTCPSISGLQVVWHKGTGSQRCK